jgi:hypothetical protein
MSRIRLLNRKCISALIILGQLVVSITAALAQIAEPEPIDGLVPNEWRAPYTQFLSGLGIKDVEKILANTKFGIFGGVHRPNSVLFRIEDNCSDDICLTIIGHLGGDRHSINSVTQQGRVLRAGNGSPPSQRPLPAQYTELAPNRLKIFWR